MKIGISWCAAVALCGVVLLTGCDKLKAKGEANVKAAEAKAKARAQEAVRERLPGQARTVYGKSMEKGRAADCGNNMRNLSQYLMMGGEYLPTSARDFTQNGCPAEVLRCPAGGDYEFLVKGRTRNAGKVKVLRCPNHGFELCSDGSVSNGR